MTRGVVGLWDGHGAGVALLAEGRLLFALSEERASRRKRHSGFPALTLALARDFAHQRGISIDEVAVAGARGRSPLRLLEPLYTDSDPHREPLGLTSLAAMGWENHLPGLPLLGRLEPLPAKALLGRRIARVLPGPFSMHAVEHHDAHAFGALLGPGRDRALVVTADAYGEGSSATARLSKGPTRVVQRLDGAFGLALLYGATTVALGYREGDEGKVMGLAATGDPEPGLHRFLELFRPGTSIPSLRRPLTRRAVARLVRDLPPRDAAAALQTCVQRLAARWINQLLEEHPAPRLHLAGGLFANVRVNQQLAGLPGIEGMYVFPAMGDEGLAAGAAHARWHVREGCLAEPIDGAALGLPRSEAEILAAARGAGVAFREVDPTTTAVEQLAADRVVCRYLGRDEYGPRALGHSSILFRADRPALAARVNTSLGRDPVMAFAPIMAADLAGDWLETPLPSPDLATMTVTADAKRALAARCPVAVHVDGTARVQLVHAEQDPDLHALLVAWHRHSGQPALINTSFNLHGEPIVHTPRDALRSFLASGLDVLLTTRHEIVAVGAAGR
jgi:carbamoyltransferase